jgi:hypothetical protein
MAHQVPNPVEGGVGWGGPTCAPVGGEAHSLTHPYLSVSSSTNAMPVLQSPQFHHDPLPLSELQALGTSNTAVCGRG